jgi:hypothetical protein
VYEVQVHGQCINKFQILFVFENVKIEEIHSYETLVTTYTTKRHQNPEDQNLNLCNL